MQCSKCIYEVTKLKNLGISKAAVKKRLHIRSQNSSNISNNVSLINLVVTSEHFVPTASAGKINHAPDPTLFCCPKIAGKSVIFYLPCHLSWQARGSR